MNERASRLLSPSEWRLVTLLGATVLFNRYAESLLGFTLVQIQRELGISESQLGFLGSVVELGAVPSIALLFLADRVGRRRVLLATVAGFALLSACTAAVGTANGLVALQFAVRSFLVAQFGLAIVTAVEELRPECRGFGVGVLGTFAIVGHGLAMIGLGLIEAVPGGWRGLFAISAIPLAILPLLSRGLSETRAFAALPTQDASWLRPLRQLLTRYPRRFVAVGAVMFLWSFSNQPIDFFLAKLAQEFHGWSPARFATLAVVGGLLGLSGQLLAGWLSDRFGRRPAMFAAFVLEPVAAIAMYSVTTVFLPPAYVFWVFASVANDVLARTTSAELFPTSTRATATGAIGLVGALGAAAGLAAEGVLFSFLGSHWAAARWIALSGTAMALIAWLAYPESSARSLDEVSPEAGPAPSA